MQMQMPPMLPLSMSTGLRRMSMNPMDYFPRHNPITPIHSMSPKQKLHTSATLSMLTPMKSLSSGGGGGGGGGSDAGCYQGMDDDGDDNESTQQRFKPFHEEKWSQRFKELLQFHKDHGHSAVPHTYPPNPQLARWVKRQRRQYKLRKDNRQSTMTTERLDLLSSVGFIWDSHDVNWREKLDTLMVYRNEHGHCNVPSNYRDKKLATWVKCQRRQYKLYWDGKPSAMSPERILELEKVGFEWEIRSTIARNNSNNNNNNGNAVAAQAQAAQQQAKMIAQEALDGCTNDGTSSDCGHGDEHHHHQDYRRYKDDNNETGGFVVGHPALAAADEDQSTADDVASSSGLVSPHHHHHHHQMRYGNLSTMPTNISEL
jgi:Helicase associated domain